MEPRSPDPARSSFKPSAAAWPQNEPRPVVTSLSSKATHIYKTHDHLAGPLSPIRHPECGQRNPAALARAPRPQQGREPRADVRAGAPPRAGALEPARSTAHRFTATNSQTPPWRPRRSRRQRRSSNENCCILSSSMTALGRLPVGRNLSPLPGLPFGQREPQRTRSATVTQVRRCPTGRRHIRGKLNARVCRSASDRSRRPNDPVDFAERGGSGFGRPQSRPAVAITTRLGIYVSLPVTG
jgi:hypothetical protein